MVHRNIKFLFFMQGAFTILSGGGSLIARYMVVQITGVLLIVHRYINSLSLSKVHQQLCPGKAV